MQRTQGLKFKTMRKIILGVAVSLDSYIEGPKGEIDWCFSDQDYGLTPFFNSIGAIFMGRKSYELAVGMGGEKPWTGMTTYVFSNTLKTVNGECTLISGDGIARAMEIKEENGKDIWLFGGTELIAGMMVNGLVDVLWLSVHPVLLGGGKPLFQGINMRVNTKLMESKVYETGLVSLWYEVIKK
jgi:dihydrofolate reductase